MLLTKLYCLRTHNRRYEPRHDKTNKVTVRPAKTQISLGICRDQSLRCAFNGQLRTPAFIMRTAKTLIRLGGCSLGICRDQSLRCAFNGQLRTPAFIMRTAKTLIRLGGCNAQSDQSLRWAHTHFFGFVMSRLN